MKNSDTETNVSKDGVLHGLLLFLREDYTLLYEDKGGNENDIINNISAYYDRINSGNSSSHSYRRLGVYHTI